jgi:hypothetical protein
MARIFVTNPDKTASSRGSIGSGHNGTKWFRSPDRFGVGLSKTRREPIHGARRPNPAGDGLEKPHPKSALSWIRALSKRHSGLVTEIRKLQIDN